MFIYALIDAYALITRRMQTFSQTVWQATKRWPLLPFFVGLCLGVLLVHLWGNGLCPA